MHTSTTHLVLCEDKPCDALPPLNASPTEKEKSPSADAIEWYRSWYLGLGARSLLALVSPILVAIVFVLVRIAMSSSHLNARVADAKQEWLAGCGSAQEEISHLRNWAYYAAPSVNAATQKEVQETVHALGHVLVLSVTALEAVLVYIVDSYRDTFLCFVVLLVQGTLSVITSALDLFNKGLTDVANGIRTAIQDSVKGINDAVAGVVHVANDLLKLLHKSVQAPQIKVPDLSALKNVTLPASFTDGLHHINNSMPSMQKIDDELDAIVRAPLTALRNDINAATANYTFTADLPRPAFHPVADICQSLTAKVAHPLDAFADDTAKMLYWLVVVLAISTGLLALFLVARQYSAWRSFDKAFSELNLSPSSAGNLSTAPGKSNPLLHCLAATVRSPLSTRVSLWLCRVARVRKPECKAMVGWLVVFATHPALELLLAVGVLGILVAGVQLALLDVALDHTSHSGGSGTPWHDAWAQANRSMYDDSAAYANKSNALIALAQNDLDTSLFRWVNTSTSSMNDTLNQVSEALSDIMNSTFASTPLEGPMQNFIYCIIGKKLEGIEDALTWIHNKSHATLPTVSPMALVVSDLPSNTGNLAPAPHKLLTKVVDTYRKELHLDLMVNGIILSVWLLILLAALFYAVLNARPLRPQTRRPRSGIRSLSLSILRSAPPHLRQHAPPVSVPQLSATELPGAESLEFAAETTAATAAGPRKPPPPSSHSLPRLPPYMPPPQQETRSRPESLQSVSSKEALAMLLDGDPHDMEGLGHAWHSILLDLPTLPVSPVVEAEDGYGVSSAMPSTPASAARFRVATSPKV